MFSGSAWKGPRYTCEYNVVPVSEQAEIVPREPLMRASPLRPVYSHDIIDLPIGRLATMAEK